MIKFCRGETSQHIYKQVFHNFQKHQTTFCITYQTLEYTICIMFWHLFGPLRFGDVGQKTPGKKFPQKNQQRKFTEDLLRFGSGRDQTTVLVEGYPVWRCSILLHPSCVHNQCSSMALFDLFVGLLREIQEGSYIIAISAKCMRARHVEGHLVSPAVDWSDPLTIFI